MCGRLFWQFSWVCITWIVEGAEAAAVTAVIVEPWQRERTRFRHHRLESTLESSYNVLSFGYNGLRMWGNACFTKLKAGCQTPPISMHGTSSGLWPIPGYCLLKHDSLGTLLMRPPCKHGAICITRTSIAHSGLIWQTPAVEGKSTYRPWTSSDCQGRRGPQESQSASSKEAGQENTWLTFLQDACV